MDNMRVYLYKGSKGVLLETFDTSAIQGQCTELNYGELIVSETCGVELMNYLKSVKVDNKFDYYELSDKVIEKLEGDYFDRSIFSEGVLEELKLILKRIGSSCRYITNWKNERIIICFREIGMI